MVDEEFNGYTGYTAVHALDAATLAGDDVRRLPYSERRRRLAILVDALEKDGEILEAEAREAHERRDPPPVHTPLRLKAAWRLDELGDALGASVARREADQWPRWAQHGVLLFPGNGMAAPPPLEPKEEWSGPHFSRSQQANYWQNKRTKVSIFERDRTPRPMSFRNCVSSCLGWEGAAPGDVSEENLAKLAEEAKARAQPQVGGE